MKDTYRMYNTQALILANFPIREDNYKVMSPDMLSTYVLNKMDIELSDYYKWLYTLLDVYPSGNTFVTMDKNKKLYYTYDLPKELERIHKLRKNVQYRYFIDKNI